MPRRSGPGRARPTQPQHGTTADAKADTKADTKADAKAETKADESPERQGPPIPPSVEAKQLAPEIRAELMTLDKTTADTVARHLVAAGELLAEDPEAALRSEERRVGKECRL